MFSKEIYKKQNGFIYQVFIKITAVLLGLFAVVVVCGILDLKIHLDWYLPEIIGMSCIVGVIGFPLSLCLYVGMRRLYVNSKLNINDNKIYYIQQTEADHTIIGRVTEYKLYNVLNITSYKISKRWIKIYGEIEKQVVYNGSKSDEKIVNHVKIARCFDTEKQIIELLKNTK